MGDADILHVIKTTVSATPCKSTHRKMEETATLTKDQRSDPCCTVQLKATVKAGLHHSCLKRWVHTSRQKMVHSFLPHDYFSWNSASVQCFLWSPSYFKTSTSDFLFESFPAVSLPGWSRYCFSTCSGGPGALAAWRAASPDSRACRIA